MLLFTLKNNKEDFEKKSFILLRELNKRDKQNTKYQPAKLYMTNRNKVMLHLRSIGN